MSAAKARRRLTRPGAWLGRGEDGLYQVHSGGVGRVVLTLDEAGFLDLAADPGLKVRAAGGWTLRRHSVERVDRAGRPGEVLGLATHMEVDGRATTRRANLAHSAIDWLARRTGPDGAPWLGPAEVAAAHRLSTEAETALKGPSVTMRWDALPRSGGGSAARVEPSDRALSASRRVEVALAVCGTSRAMVEAVCLRATALQVAEHGLGLRRREGRVLLTRGLRALAAHYHIG